MARRNKRKPTPAEFAAEVMRMTNHREKAEAMSEGRRERAQTFQDRRRKANRQACRGKFSPAD